jgi:hypothetical protein
MFPLGSGTIRAGQLPVFLPARKSLLHEPTSILACSFARLISLRSSAN